MKIGFQEINISPCFSVRRMLSVEMHEAVSDDLHCRILAWKEDQISICHISVDTVELYEVMRNRIKKIIQKHLGKTTQVITSATHSHCCPCLTTDKKYQKFLLDQIDEKMIAFAYQEYKKVSYVYQYRFFDKIGKSRIKGHESNYVFAETLSFFDNEKRLGTILMHNAHPTIKKLGTGDFTSEYPGKVIQILKQKYPNEFFTFMLGPAGEISSRFIRKSQSYEEMVRLSNLLANEYIIQLETQGELKKIPIDHMQYEEKNIKIVYQKKDYDNIVIPKSIKGKEKSNLLSTLKDLKKNEVNLSTRDILFSRLQFSNLYTIIFSPFEMVSSYESYINKTTTSLITISNGFEHYITEINCDYFSAEVLEDSIATETKVKICNLLKDWSI